MIIQALQIMLFGMLGIFIVMGIIIVVINLLNKAFKTKEAAKPAQQKNAQQ